ncbi:hypothetical protein [Methylovulum miyakonense]|uniref:hypothetical protein n=1 Tax=Methylovulum miyakonense TaxID=645578 RepID=UPI00036132EE|nr:hypothetical protein [Methylovulum miyakonense]
MSVEQQTEAVQTAWIYSTVQQFTKRHPAFTVGGLRHQIFHAETNELAKSGAIVRNGRRILIKEAAYFSWLESQSSKGVK